jgi:energy-coupling factor transport system substrate-specific component
VTATGDATTGWRTRDIVVTAVIAVAFGVFFWAFGFAWAALGFLGPAGPQNLLYAGWLLPAIVAPLIVRKPGAALFAELVAASLSALLGSQWSLDTILSGAMQGGAAELVFLAARYRNWSLPVVVAASVAATAAAFVHDWLIYYPAYEATALAVLAGFMVVSGIVVLPFVARAIVAALRQAGVLEGFPT